MTAAITAPTALYTMTTTVETATDTEVIVSERLAEGDVERLKRAFREVAGAGDTVTHSVVASVQVEAEDAHTEWMLLPRS